jgi:hypothetical protein
MQNAAVRTVYNAETMKLVRAVSIATAVYVICLAADCRAGCPNVCEVSADRPMVVPPLDCLDVKTMPQTCDCSLWVTLRNDCVESVDLVDFVLLTCGRPGASLDQRQRSCQTLPAGFDGPVDVKLAVTEPIGPGEKRLNLRRQGADHAIVASFVIHSFGTDGCSVRPAGRENGNAGPVGLVALYLVLRLRRRHLRPSLKSA